MKDKENNDHAKKTETILYHVWYPARMKITMDTEMPEIEFLEERSYTVNITIINNQGCKFCNAILTNL